MSNMMFPAAFLSSAPQLQTRKALLVLDLQNDFIDPKGKLPVENIPEFLGRVTNLASNFRATGEVVWVSTEFEGPRSTIDADSGAYEVVLEDFLPQQEQPEEQQLEQAQGHPESLPTRSLPVKVQAETVTPPPHVENPETCAVSTSQSALPNLSDSIATPSRSPQPPSVNDAFLAGSDGGPSKNCCVPGSPGCQFPDSVLSSIDTRYDTLLVKSHYSAFRATPLLMSLRMKLVTELFLCGSLSNVAVYSTALDAVRHGFSVTVIEDCVGFRSRPVHEESMRQMADMMGVNGVTSTELIDEIEEDLEGHDQDLSAMNPAKSSAVVGALELPRDKHTALRPQIQDWVSQVAAYNIPSDIPPFLELYDADQAVLDTSKTDANGGVETPLITSKIDASEVVRCGDSHESLPNPRKRSTGEVEDAEPEPKSAFTARGHRSSRDSPDHEKEQPRVQPNRIRLRRHKDANRHRRSPDKTSDQRDEIPVSLLGDSLVQQLQHQSTPYGNRGDSAIIPDDESIAEDVDTMMITSLRTAKARGLRIRKGSKSSELGPTDSIGEGDFKIMYNVLPEEDAAQAFRAIKDEVQWQKMYHQSGEVPRLVACQGFIGPDGAIPVYRHPADESHFKHRLSPPVHKIRKEVERVLAQPYNHVLIQLYRSGEDNISEHSDKTLDIARGSSIVNISLGAQRTMTLRTKKQPTAVETVPDVEKADVNPTGDTRAPSHAARQVQKIPMPHNSMFVLGESTNRRCLHSIRPDKRPHSQRLPQEIAFDGERISLTFRCISTFLDPEKGLIWGQGATSKSRDTAGQVVENEEAATEKMIQAFGHENQSMEFDWAKYYGDGFDVVNLKVVDKPLARAELGATSCV